MSLVNCKECKHKISKKAQKCPNCGAPVKKKTSMFTWLVGVIVAIPVFVMLQNTANKPSYNKPITKAPVYNVDKSTNAQNERMKIMQRYINDGYVLKYEVPAKYPHIYVTPKFTNLDIDTKKSVASVVMGYYYSKNEKADILVFKDSRTGKDIGQYNQYGLKLK